jgi:hypothetical protein
MCKILRRHSSLLHVTQHKHRRPSDLCSLGHVEQDTSVVSDLLIYPPHKTLFLAIYTVSSGSAAVWKAQFALHAVTNGRRHLGALSPLYGDREQFINTVN